MKTLVIGGGSMGRRRLRDLTFLDAGETLLCEPEAERCREVAAAFGVQGFTDFDEAPKAAADALVISTPPVLHDQYVKAGMERGLHIFAEVPFVYDLAAASRIAGESGKYFGALVASHTIRYYPPYRLIHDLLQQGAIGRPLYLEYSLDQYLPGWRPYEDYRKFYGGDVRMGGAGMDMIFHEIPPIQWWMGPIKTVCARFSKLSALDIEGPDAQDMLLGFASGASGFFHNDVIERGSVGRHIRIAGENGTLEWHQNQPAIRLFEASRNSSREAPFSEAADWEEALAASREMAEILTRQKVASGQPPSATSPGFLYESCYLREMRTFIEAAAGRSSGQIGGMEDELRTISVFHAIWRSSEDPRETVV